MNKYNSSTSEGFETNQIKFAILTANLGDNIIKVFPEYTDSNETFFSISEDKIAFKTSENNYVIYDILDSNENEDSLNELIPDLSIFKEYNYITAPLSVRMIRTDNNGYIIPDKTFSYKSSNYAMINCDSIKYGESIFDYPSNGFFLYSSSISTIGYDYKPFFFIREFDSSNTNYYDPSGYINSSSNSEIEITKLPTFVDVSRAIIPEENSVHPSKIYFRFTTSDDCKNKNIEII